MQAGQTGYGLNGKQNFLFPLENMYLTQGSYTATYSHNGCYAMDFDGYLNGQFVTLCPYYAPFDCTLVAKWGSTSIACVWQSDNIVNFVDGTSDYACIQFNHDNANPSRTIGEHYTQGQLMGHTGTQGASADHIHIEAKKGTYDGYHQNSQGVWMLTNSTWLYDLMGVNDTNLIKTYYVDHNGTRHDYPWDTFFINIPIPHPHPQGGEKGKKYPWYIIYNRNMHQRM